MALPTIELCSSPPAIPATAPCERERSTSSSRPYPFRCLNVAPCVWPWSDRTTISNGRGAYWRARPPRAHHPPPLRGAPPPPARPRAGGGAPPPPLEEVAPAARPAPP